MYRGTGVSHGVRRTTWERSLKIGELQIPCFEEFLGGEHVLGLVPASLPHTLSARLPLQSPAVKTTFFVQILGGEKLLKFVEKCR